jgi:sn-glycerol 3-phosphate transport system ATP-binding protein
MNLIPVDSLDQPGALPKGGMLGIRPEDIVLDPKGQPARLTGVEYLGADQLAAFEIGPDARRVRVLVRVPARHALPADGHALSWSDSAAHVFGPDGLRLSALLSPLKEPFHV